MGACHFSFFIPFGTPVPAAELLCFSETLLSPVSSVTIPLHTSPSVSISSDIDIPVFCFFCPSPFFVVVYHVVVHCCLSWICTLSFCVLSLPFPDVYPSALLDPEITAQTCWMELRVCPSLAVPTQALPFHRAQGDQKGAGCSQSPALSELRLQAGRRGPGLSAGH